MIDHDNISSEAIEEAYERIINTMYGSRNTRKLAMPEHYKRSGIEGIALYIIGNETRHNQKGE